MKYFVFKGPKGENVKPDSQMLPETSLKILNNVIYDNLKLFYTFEAATWEEAGAIYSLREGLGYPNEKLETQNCECGEFVYKSGECWNCGKGTKKDLDFPTNNYETQRCEVCEAFTYVIGECWNCGKGVYK